MPHFTGRVAAVTGASSGIGRAVVVELAHTGARVVGTARSQLSLETLEREINGAEGHRFVGVAGDITNQTTLAVVASTCLQEFGASPDVIVLSAGQGLPGSLLTSDPTQWADLFDVNVLSVLYQLRWAAELMLGGTTDSRDKPRDIVVLGSIVGRTVSPANPIYGATKFALHSAVEALRQEMARHRIRVSLIEPGFVKTEFQVRAGYDMERFDAMEMDIGPFLSPQNVASCIAFMIGLPHDVHVSDLVIRPTRQSYP